MAPQKRVHFSFYSWEIKIVLFVCSLAHAKSASGGVSAYWKFPLGELPLENNLGSPFSSRRLYSCPSSLGPLPAWKEKSTN